MAQHERENFYRNSTVIVDHGKEALAKLLESDLNIRNLTLEDFINQNQHEIYHMCYNRNPCCQCTNRVLPSSTPRSRVMVPDQLDKLLDCGTKLPGHNTGSWSCHCCSVAKKTLTINKLDITLLRCLLINFCKSCQAPSPQRHAVEILIENRNKLYGHAESASINDTEYARYKKNIEGALLVISRYCNFENEMLQKLKDVESRSLDETICIQYQNLLLEEIKQHKDIKEEMQTLKRHIDDTIHNSIETTELQMKESFDEMSTGIAKGIEKLDLRTEQTNELVTSLSNRKKSKVDTRLENIIDHSRSKIKDHIQDDTYVETRAVTVGADILEQRGLLILVAKGGTGKTKIALQLASKYMHKMFLPMIFIDDEIKHKRDVIDLNEKCIIILEDLFGRTNVQFVDEDHTHILDMLLNFAHQSNNIKIVLTLRSDNCDCKSNIFDKHDIFSETVIVDLDERWQLTESEKRQILLKNMQKFCIAKCCCCNSLEDACDDDIVETPNSNIIICQSVIEDIVFCNARAGYPQSCRMFCIDKNLTKLGTKYFTNTTQCLVGQINDLFVKGLADHTAKYQYSLLLFAALKGSINSVTVTSDLLWIHIVKLLWNDIRMTSKILLENALSILNGKYLVIKQTMIQTGTFIEYIFQHQTIREAVLISYGTDYPKDLLDAVDLDFIDEYIEADTSTCKDFFAQLKVPQSLLVERIVTLLKADVRLFYQLGKYIRNHTLMKRNDSLFEAFIEEFPRIKLGKGRYRLLCDVLTNNGKCSKLLEYHPIVCKDFLITYGGIDYVSNFCRPESSMMDNSKFVILKDENLVEKIVDLLNDQAFFKLGRHTWIKTGRYLCTIGISEGNVEFVKKFLQRFLEYFTKQKIRCNLNRRLLFKYFVDGLSCNDSCKDAISTFSDFFQTISEQYKWTRLN